MWGSNEHGQLKQSEVKAVYIPVLLKVGSQSSVLDIACGSDFTVILVNGLDSRPALYYCGKNYERKKSMSFDSDGAVEETMGKATAQRLSPVDKVRFQFFF